MTETTPEQAQAQIYEFLSFIRSAQDPADSMEIRVIDKFARNPRVISKMTTCARDAEEFVLKNISFDTYVGVLGRKNGLKGNENAGQRTILWADIDYGSDGHKNSDHPDKASALEALKALPTPSALVATGGGLHAYWVLREPIDPYAWDGAMLGIANAIKSDASTRNPERILRVAGTKNWKPVAPPAQSPRPVSAIHINDIKYDISDFPSAQTEIKRAAKKLAEVKQEVMSHEAISAIDLARLVPIEKVIEWLQIPTHVESGATRAKCPCHDGATPNSLLIGGNGHNSARCFGACNANMSTLDLVMNVRKIPIKESAEWILERLNASKASSAEVVSEPWQNKLIMAKNGMPKPLEANLALILSNDPEWVGKVRFDRFKRKVIINDRDLLDVDATKMMIWFQRNLMYQMTPTRPAVEHALALVARENEFNSLTDYVRSLEWDGVSRVNDWMAHAMVVSGAQNSEIGRVWLIGMAQRALIPGSQFDYTLCLLGPQGTRKTSAFLALVGEDRFGYLLGVASGKDAEIALAGKWLVEIEEGYELKHSPEKTKAFITRRSDDYRSPFAVRNEQFKRQCTFGLATNRDKVTNDLTGARRYLPVSISDQINDDWIVENRDQLFAEASVMVRSGAIPVLQCDDLQQTIIVPDYWVAFFKGTTHNNFGIDGAVNLLKLNPKDMTDVSTERMINALKLAGFELNHANRYVRNRDNVVNLRGENNGTKAISDRHSKSMGNQCQIEYTENSDCIPDWVGQDGYNNSDC